MSQKNTKADSGSEDFEVSLRKLEDIVRQLETGELPLEKALERYESGMQLVGNCRRMLDNAEQRIALLTKTDGAAPELAPAGVDEDGVQQVDDEGSLFKQ